MEKHVVGKMFSKGVQTAKHAVQITAKQNLKTWLLEQRKYCRLFSNSKYLLSQKSSHAFDVENLKPKGVHNQQRNKSDFAPSLGKGYVLKV